MSIFNHYFEDLEKVYLQEFNTLPTITYTEKIRKEILVGDVNEDGEIQWKAVKQTQAVDWENIEKIFGFTVSEELKEYYSTFYFFNVTGSISDIYIRLYPVGCTKEVARDVKQHFADGKYDFPRAHIFLIGDASVGMDDNYFVYYDNSTQEVFCYDRETKRKFVIAKSLAELFSTIKAEY